MRLTSREKRLVWVGGAMALLALAYRFWLGPLLDERARLASQVAKLGQEVQRVSALAVRYRELKGREQAFDRLVVPDGSRESVLRAVEVTLRELGLRERLLSANPGHAPINQRYEESSLQVQLGGLKWEEVLRFLHRLEGGKSGIWVKRFRLVVNEGTKRLDGELHLSAFVRRDGKEGAK
jgi:type II secretory pathway component PulM